MLHIDRAVGTSTQVVIVVDWRKSWTIKWCSIRFIAVSVLIVAWAVPLSHFADFSYIVALYHNYLIIHEVRPTWSVSWFRQTENKYTQTVQLKDLGVGECSFREYGLNRSINQLFNSNVFVQISTRIKHRKKTKINNSNTHDKEIKRFRRKK